MAGRPIGARADATPKKITDRERRAKALTLRKAGNSYQQIADTEICSKCGHASHPDVRVCGYKFCECEQSVSGRLYSAASAARRAVKHALAEVITVPAEELLQLELERLDTLQQAAWVPALKGNAEQYRNVLRTMERRSKYLGLDDFDRRLREFEDAAARADERIVDQIEALVGAVLARLDLPPDAQWQAPQIIAEELARLGLAEGESRG